LGKALSWVMVCVAVPKTCYIVHLSYNLVLMCARAYMCDYVGDSPLNNLLRLKELIVGVESLSFSNIKIL
uniref:Uncharacterized protein n=1 Tax=Electrophorus electricus TaxID=8005 RepID=A0AAY5ENX5_ELEEL